MSLVAEPARPHDLAGALDLLGRADLTGQDVAEGWGHFFVVREDDGRVVGVAGLEVHGESGLLRSVAVDPAYRGQSLGARLVRAAMERAALLGLREVYLLTTTAERFFARRGFATCPREDAPPTIAAAWEFRSGCPATAVFMKRPVG
jgi:amino-acid N-acetyltransferase